MAAGPMSSAEHGGRRLQDCTARRQDASGTQSKGAGGVKLA
jgi:hypothetical protein